MTIVEFYRAVSDLLAGYRKGMTDSQALRRLRSLNASALDAGIEAQVSEDILRDVSVFDDENSYDEDEVSYDDSSYED